MKNKIISIFIEKKKKLKELDQPKDDMRQHTLQKPVLTGYTTNQP